MGLTYAAACGHPHAADSGVRAQELQQLHARISGDPGNREVERQNGYGSDRIRINILVNEYLCILAEEARFCQGVHGGEGSLAVRSLLPPLLEGGLEPRVLKT